MIPSTHYLAHLGRHVSWLQVLPATGENWVAKLNDIQIPKRFLCPFCDSERYWAVIYPDRTLGGEWVHCPTCGFAGDVIEFAAAKWKLDPVTTVRELAARGIGPHSEYLTDRVLAAYHSNLAYRQAFRQLWLEAQAALPRQETPGIRELSHQLGFSRDLVHQDWSNRGGRFIGATDTYKLHEAFCPQRSQPRLAPTRSGYGQRGDERLSPENPLSPDVVILPFFDLPGRIASLGVVGNTKREGRLHMVCRRLHTDRSPVTSENGLWMFENLLGDTEPGFHTTFVLDDPLLAMQLQLQHLRTNLLPLPMVAMFCNEKFRPEHVWGQNPPKHYTFWSPEISANLLRQARLVEGQVSLREIDRNTCVEQIQEGEPHVWLHGLKRSGKHWYRGLELCLKRMDDEDAKALALSMELNVPERQQYMGQVSPAGAARFRELVPELAVKERVYCDRIVQETSMGWVNKKAGVILNGYLRVSDVIILPADDKRKKSRYWRGEFIATDGGHHPFLVKARWNPNQDRSTRELCSQMADQGVQVIVPKGWASGIWDIAVLFHEPRLIHGSRRVGWHKEEGCFVFPEFVIRCDGSTERCRRMVVERDTPWRGSRLPEPLVPIEITALGKNDDAIHLLWTGAAFAVHQLLAPFQDWPEARLVLDGNNAKQADRWVGHIFHLPHLPPKQRGRRHAALIGDDFAGSWLQVRSVMTQSGRVTFPGSGTGTPPSISATTAEKLVIGYLRDVLARQVTLPRVEGTRVKEILKDMVGWFRSLGGKPAVIRAAERATAESDEPPAYEWADTAPPEPRFEVRQADAVG